MLDKIIKLMEDIKSYKDNNILDIYQIGILRNYYKDLEKMADGTIQLDILRYDEVKRLFNKFKRQLKEMN